MISRACDLHFAIIGIEKQFLVYVIVRIFEKICNGCIQFNAQNFFKISELRRKVGKEMYPM